MGLLAKLAFPAVIVARFLAALVLPRRADVDVTPTTPLARKKPRSSMLQFQAIRHHGKARANATSALSATHSG